MADPTPKPSLMEMYTNLQFDPQDHRRKAAFIALCWQHIHQHIRETPDWILRVRNGSIQLANRIEKTPYRPKHLNWNQKLNEIAYSFAVTLGPQIWPDWDWRDLPAHIARFLPPGTANMRGTEANYTVTRLRTRRLVSAGAVITEEIALLESRIGSNTRGFLRCLLESSMPIPLEQPTRAVDLLPAFLNIIHLQPRQQPFSKRDNRLTPISDITVGEDKDLEEGEIRESPRNRPQPPNSEGRRRLDVGVEVEAEEDEVAEQPVRKRPCMISPAGLAQYQSMLSGSIHRRPDSLHTSAVRSELVGSVRNRDDKHLQPKTYQKSSPASSHQICLSSSVEIAEGIDGTGIKHTRRDSAAPTQSGEFAPGGCLRTSPGIWQTSTISKYCCLLDICPDTFQTTEQLVQHLEAQHYTEYENLLDVATTLDNETSQQSWARTNVENRCWLHDCRKALHTLEQHNAHVQHQHSEEHLEFLRVGKSSLDRPSQHLPTTLNTKPGKETVASDASKDNESHDEHDTWRLITDAGRHARALIRGC